MFPRVRREAVDYFSPAGELYPLSVPAPAGRWVIGASGLGLPPVEYATTRGPAQNGVTVRDFALGPRIIQLLIRQQFCSRDGWWAGRSAILDGLRPNRQLIATAAVPGTLRFTRADGSRRSIGAFLEAGPGFEPSQVGRWDEWAFQEVLRFFCPDPVFYDAQEQAEAFVASDQLVFPVTFPLVFGALAGSTAITYTGTWPEYPTIVITGPATSPRVENTTTGEFIEMDTVIPAGVSVTIALSYGQKTVTDSLGNNLIGTVTTDSDLATFHLAAAPEAPGGVNVITVSATGTGGASSIVLTYYRRYIGM